MKKPKTPRGRGGRPPKNGVARVLGTRLAAPLQAELKAYARDLAHDEPDISFSDIVTRAVQSYRPFRAWRARQKGA